MIYFSFYFKQAVNSMQPADFITLNKVQTFKNVLYEFYEQ